MKVVRGQSPETDYLVDNPNRRCPDIAKARQELQYRPRVTLEEGLRRTLLWYTGNQGGGGTLMRVAVVGAGYVGLVTAVGLAELGHTVTCIDIDERKVAALSRGEPPSLSVGSSRCSGATWGLGCTSPPISLLRSRPAS